MNFINNRRAMRSQSGFTLIELLVVIAILGILAGVVVFAVGGIADNGQDSACAIELRTLKTAVQAYRAENNEYPPNGLADLVGGEFLDEAPTNHEETVAGTLDGTGDWTAINDCA